ncbi:MAG: preprotein translocase subunit SecG [Candidatus Chisholmbacteria bacterium RIFCSPHIGHO2_12_FULL_49_9]|uniref:Protein-export membrane protein SecG n=1 Tax=Candidatus Chisholmbacteria bacterium RIFCSPHIGHO2_01_FULL_52_32 TaxID=1797591 RepID=A0A1G1VSJ0_9BACT|nr:MAG: preprotein translocase subunit SecG [Candidatus Chisholmbacteria bacterium RIFCSPHIGHO2_01_FULL_52_32]OGY20263.1 MAG: preprotein translocase subunit SecG [Candidatus Chisholmbacteria bacterium RIFCSPLOWO2_01_FULL_50_28]OGY20896.1 MAG: preprotein translocase subunit SecG [Candidatus Chisholmbacteria bacterium RIFCSPHIGHO2_12_FULL_49_9]
MRNVLLVIQIIVSILLMGTILLQARGTGLGSAWGGGGEMYRSKRGVERVLLVATVVLTVLFLTLAAVNFALR